MRVHQYNVENFVFTTFFLLFYRTPWEETPNNLFLRKMKQLSYSRSKAMFSKKLLVFCLGTSEMKSFNLLYLANVINVAPVTRDVSWWHFFTFFSFFFYSKCWRRINRMLSFKKSQFKYFDNQIEKKDLSTNNKIQTNIIFFTEA